MNKDNKRYNLVPLATKILYGELDENLERDFLNALIDVEVEKLDNSSMVWALQGINFLELNNMNDRVKFILIQEAKLKLLARFVATNEYLKSVLMNTDLLTEEIYTENENGAKIFKQYIPTSNTPFFLPKKGTFENLRIVSYDDEGNEYNAVVTINDTGLVQDVIEPLTKVENSLEPTEFNDLYTDLLTDILKYDEK